MPACRRIPTAAYALILALAPALGLAASAPSPLQTQAVGPAPQQLVLLRWTQVQGREGWWTVLRHTGITRVDTTHYTVPEGSDLIITKVMATLDTRQGVLAWGIVHNHAKGRLPAADTLGRELDKSRRWLAHADAAKALYLPPEAPQDGQQHLLSDELDLGYGFPCPPGSQLACLSDAPGKAGAFPLIQMDCIGYFQPSRSGRPGGETPRKPHDEL